jgi:hypothetical protein
MKCYIDNYVRLQSCIRNVNTGPLAAERAGEKRSLAGWASTRIRLMAKREIGKDFSFFKSFSKFTNHLNSNQV